MMASSPVAARATPPETGASTRKPPAAITSASNAWVTAGTPELMSMTMQPCFRPASTPSGPRSTSATMALVGSMVITTSLPSASARGVGAVLAAGCAARKRATASASTSSTVSS